MMRLFINALAANAGGGLTYIRNVVPHLAEVPDLFSIIALSPDLRQEFSGFANNIDFLEVRATPGRRVWLEQLELPRMIRRHRADILLSAGNFASRRPGVPQILLSRNSIYFSPDFFKDLRERREYRMWLDTRMRGVIARRSIRWADATVAPSEAFAAELRNCGGDARIVAIPHGFDRQAFCGDTSLLASHLEAKLRGAENSLKLLLVSHYNYYRNFETVIRALPILRDRLRGHSIKLLLTCKLAPGANPGSYNPARAASLVRDLGVSDMVVELGAVPYRQLHHLYRRANVYVTAAYTETFAHPLVEAMASNLPVVASDLAVHREICGEIAAYFPRFSAEALAERVAGLVQSPESMRSRAAEGEKRSHQFSWKTHVEKIVDLARDLSGGTADTSQSCSRIKES
jgi:glycosyltransferase involved in cell wall biosynthesis